MQICFCTGFKLLFDAIGRSSAVDGFSFPFPLLVLLFVLELEDCTAPSGLTSCSCSFS